MDIKKLWGLSAGRCSHPECDEECVQYLIDDDPTIIGEMAHIIAKSPKGPRGNMDKGSDNYENLILLCPTHHRKIDKSPDGTYPVEKLLHWKSSHEDKVRQMLKCHKYTDKKEVCVLIMQLLIENNQIWKLFGPDSETANYDLISNIVDIWVLRKLDTIVPNNTKIINLIENNTNLFTINEYKMCRKFIEHAKSFEHNCYIRSDSVPKFPIEFEEMIKQNV